MADENTQVVGGVQDTTPEKPIDATDETFDPARAMALINKLREENKAYKSKAKKADEYEAAETARQQSEMTEAEKLRKELEATKANLAKREREAMQREVAARVGIPSSLASRLTGETPEDMEMDAKTILAEIQKAAKPTAPPVGATNPGSGASATETPAQKRERLMGGSTDIFSHGGGIYWGPDQPPK